MILIDNMDMPKCCSECDFEIFNGSTDECLFVYNGYTDKIRTRKRLDNCPIYEVTADPDTVSRKAVIEDVCTMLRNCFDASDEMIESVKITVGELPPSPSRPQWIPCSKRLPEVGAVLITDGNEILIGEYYVDNTWSVDGCDYNPDLEKIAWMPLPEPYHNS